tara:strand:+ start:7000 stop:7596 length:597 start_codon:yes stop_codon:yes gene_type:complete
LYLKRFFFTFTVIILSLLVYLYVVIFSQPTLEKDLRSQYLKGGDFQLMSNEKPFSLNQLQGRPVILYFGYTYCPDVCPVGLAVIRNVLNSAPDEFTNVSVVFITLDPDRDTTDKLKEYVSFFHQNIIPLRGRVEDIQNIIKSYGGFFRKVTPADKTSNEYVVDHSAYYYLIDSKGELMRVFDHSVSVGQLAESLRGLL